MTLIDIEDRYRLGKIDRQNAIKVIQENYAITHIGAVILVDEWDGLLHRYPHTQHQNPRP